MLELEAAVQRNAADATAWYELGVKQQENEREQQALLALLVPHYQAEGKAYVTVAIGCTGGRHRSVHVAERIGARLRAEGFSPTITHRDLGAAPQDSLEGSPASK